jgi:predicted nucleic acid-binding protein
MPIIRASDALPGVVLDTNAVLDWLVFRDPGMRVWAQAIEQARLQWLACASMRDELQRTLTYAQLARWQPDTAQVLATFDRCSCACSPPSGTGLPGLHCSDPDDQVFVDLALAEGARWLVTHDRALLRMARATQRRGLLVLRPTAGAAVIPPL